MAMSSKMMMAAAALLVLAASVAEARNIKTTENKDEAVVQPQTFPPFDRLGGSPGAGSFFPGSGGLPGSSIPGFSLPGSGSIGSMPLFGSPGFSGFGGMPGSPAAGSVPEHANKP